MQTKTKLLAVCLATPLVSGALSAALTHRDMATLAITKPPLYPPDFVFPLVWTVQYLLLGLASYRIVRAQHKQSIASYRIRIAVAYYALGLAAAFVWPFIFFRYHAYTIAFAALCAIIVIALRTYHSFAAIDKGAGCLLLPYLAWLLFAGYLSLAVMLTN